MLDLTSVRRGSRIKWTNAEKKNDTDSFFLVTTLKELPLLCLARGISDLLVCGCVWWWGDGVGVNVSGRSDMLFCLLR